MRSAVLFLIFNRPVMTRAAFAAIRAARPPRLYIAADGPRPGKAGEEALCREAREIASAVDWPCEVKTLYRKHNLGCALAVSSAITWFFSREEEGVILEDDILASPDFFRFCDELLERYRHVPEVMNIAGHNYQMGLRQPGPATYYFSRFANIWGWATWRRAWQHFDPAMQGVLSFVKHERPRIIPDPGSLWDFSRIYVNASLGRVNSWAAPWSYSMLRRGGLVALSSCGLTQNIGFGGGTHCLGASLWKHARVRPMPEIVHPENLDVNIEADTAQCRFAYGSPEPGDILSEGFRRIVAGAAYANEEMCGMARDLWGDSFVFDCIDALSYVALGRIEEARGTALRASRMFRAEMDSSRLGAFFAALRQGSDPAVVTQRADAVMRDYAMALPAGATASHGGEPA